MIAMQSVRRGRHQNADLIYCAAQYCRRYGDKDIEVHASLTKDEFHDIIEGTFAFSDQFVEKKPL
jgi:hypothetical protein